MELSTYAMLSSLTWKAYTEAQNEKKEEMIKMKMKAQSVFKHKVRSVDFATGHICHPWYSSIPADLHSGSKPAVSVRELYYVGKCIERVAGPGPHSFCFDYPVHSYPLSSFM